MKLNALVGKMAIRTAEPLKPEIHFDFGFPVVRTNTSPRRKYMDEPVKIVNVKEDQVAIEEHGVRKLLDRRFIDDHWMDYDKFLHPEKEEQDKNEKMMDELDSAVEPIKHFLEDYAPACTVTISLEKTEMFNRYILGRR